MATDVTARQNGAAPFDPREHMRSLKGSEYLDVKWRLVWFRQACPEGKIATRLLERTDTFALFCADVEDGRGGRASAHGSETKADFGDFIEKAETKAVGRALAYLGYGTQFAPDLNEGERIADAPVESRGPRRAAAASDAAPSSPVAAADADAERTEAWKAWAAALAEAGKLNLDVTALAAGKWPQEDTPTEKLVVWINWLHGHVIKARGAKGAETAPAGEVAF